MKLILYFGHYGSTEKAGKLIAEGLKDCEVIDGNKIGKVDYSSYDEIIFGINVHIYRLNRSFKKFYKAFRRKKINIKQSAYIIAADKTKKNLYIEQATKLLPKDSLIMYLGGILDPSKAKGLSKIVINSCIKDLEAEDLALPQIDLDAVEMFILNVKRQPQLQN